MNKTDYEVLLQYVEETDKKYLFKYRFQQFCNELKEFFRKW